jgi:outer membrane assembly lipoprotein yfiO
MSRYIVLYAVLSLMLFLTGCDSYDKLLKSTNTEKQYAAAMQYYQKGKYTRSKELLERVLPMSRATQRADTVCYYLAKSYFAEGDYSLSGYMYEQLMTNYPRSSFVEEATFQTAYCNYLESPRPALDQTFTEKAIAGFNNFMSAYPKSKRIGEAKLHLKTLYGKILRKEFEAAKLYYNMEMYRAAVSALKYSLEKYPVSPYREEQCYLLVKSNYLFAVNSIESKRRERFQQTVDASLSYISEFPTAKNAKEVLNYYLRSMEFLGYTPDMSVIPEALR